MQKLPEYDKIDFKFLSTWQLVLLRGLPGSGKSTLARHIIDQDEELWRNNKYDYNEDTLATGGWEHCEADNYFLRPDGVYDFNGNLIPRAHQWCQDETRRLLRLCCSVVVSNTFTTKKEMEPYIKIAQELKTPLTVIDCTGNFQNTHNVPPDVLEKMRKRWQSLKTIKIK